MNARANLTIAALLESFVCPGNVIAASGRCFKLNYVKVEPPFMGEKVLTDAGGRMWLPKVRIRNFSGSTAVGMRQKAALDLAGLDPDASDSKENHFGRIW